MRLPNGALARMGTTRLRHGDAVFFAAYTPDGKALVTAGRDRTVRLWNLATAKEIHQFEWMGGQAVSTGEPSPAGPFEKQQRQMLDDIALSSQAAPSSDGKVVAASRGGLVCLWETAGGKKLRHFQTGQQRLVHLAFSADGKSLVTIGPNGQVVTFWEVATGKCLRDSRAPLPPSYYRNELVPVNEQNAIVSPGLKYLAFQWREPSGNRRIHVRELATGKELPPIHVGGYGGTLSLCFSADEKTLMWDDWYAGGGIVFSDVTTGKELRRLGDRRPKDGTYLDATEQTLAIAALARWQLPGRLPSEPHHRIVGSHNGQIHLSRWEANRGTALPLVPRLCGRLRASGPGFLSRWQEAGKQSGWRQHPPVPHRFRQGNLGAGQCAPGVGLVAGAVR